MSPVVSKGFWARVKEIFWDAGVAGLMATLVDRAKEETKKQANERLCDRRAELLADFVELDRDVAKPVNLIRRHKEAERKLRENRFVSLLCKLPRGAENKKLRQDMLMYLDSLDDVEFEQMLDLLDHDVFMQWFQRARRDGGKIFREFAIRLDYAAGEAAPYVRRFNDWLANRTGGRS